MLYGGFYMDYDSDFGVLLDDAILPTDTLLVAQVTPLIRIYHHTRYSFNLSSHTLPTYHNTLYQSSHPTHTHNTGRHPLPRLFSTNFQDQ